VVRLLPRARFHVRRNGHRLGALVRRAHRRQEARPAQHHQPPAQPRPVRAPGIPGCEAPRLSFKLGLLLLGVFPTDILTSTAVGFHLAREGSPWYYCLTFVLVTTFLIALPGLLVLVMGRRAVEALPKVRDWMNANSWIVSEAVIALFVGLQINTLISS
jgi:hypothetical protein